MGRTPRQLVGSRPHGKEEGWRATARCQRLRSVGLVTVRDQTLQHTTIKKFTISMGVIFRLEGQKNRPGLTPTYRGGYPTMILLPWEIAKYILSSQKWISQRFRQGSIPAGRGTSRLWTLITASLGFFTTCYTEDTLHVEYFLLMHICSSHTDAFRICCHFYLYVTVSNVHLNQYKNYQQVKNRFSKKACFRMLAISTTNTNS